MSVVSRVVPSTWTVTKPPRAGAGADLTTGTGACAGTGAAIGITGIGARADAGAGRPICGIGTGPTPAMTASSSRTSMPTGHQAMHRPQPTQPLEPNWSHHVENLWVSHWR